MVTSPDIVIYGVGGHARKVYHTAILAAMSIVGFINDESNANDFFLGKKVFKKLDDALEVCDDFFIAIGDPVIRKKLSDIMLQRGKRLVNICHPTAYICSDVQLCSGIFVGANAVVESNATISDGCIIDIGSLIDHDAIIKEFVHVRPGTIVSSYSIC